jgi:hypothetical protein
VLAAVAIVIVRKQVHASYSAEPRQMLQGIRAAEHQQLIDANTYLGCSGALLTNYYPQNGNPDTKKYDFRATSHPHWPCWRQLNLKADSPVRYGYAIAAGAGPGSFPVIPGIPTQPTWPDLDGGLAPWFVAHAAGDIDGDGVRSSFWSSSFDKTIAVHEEAE